MLNPKQQEWLTEIQEISELIGKTKLFLVLEPRSEIRQKHMENLTKMQALLEVTKKAFSDSLSR